MLCMFEDGIRIEWSTQPGPSLKLVILRFADFGLKKLGVGFGGLSRFGFTHMLTVFVAHNALHLYNTRDMFVSAWHASGAHVLKYLFRWTTEIADTKAEFKFLWFCGCKNGLWTAAVLIFARNLLLNYTEIILYVENILSAASYQQIEFNFLAGMSSLSDNY